MYYIILGTTTSQLSPIWKPGNLEARSDPSGPPYRTTTVTVCAPRVNNYNTVSDSLPVVSGAPQVSNISGPVLFLASVKGNVAVYKVLNLEMLLYKVRWHVSTVKESPDPDATYAYALTQRDRTRIGDRSCLLRWSEQEKSACMTFNAVRKDEQETADLFYISRLWPGC